MSRRPDAAQDEENDSFIPARRKVDSVSLKHGNRRFRPVIGAPLLAGLQKWRKVSALLCGSVVVLVILLSIVAHSRHAHLRHTPFHKGGRRPFIILFGDSITQFAFDGKLDGWATALADKYARTADVLNRGVAGYTTRDGLAVLDDVFPAGKGLLDPPSLVTIMFGSNDLLTPGAWTREDGKDGHVPLEEYKQNLRKIVAHIRQLKKDLPVVLMTPPPTHNTRPNNEARKYGLAVLEVGKEAGVPVLDTWSTLDGAHEDKRGAFLVDGLHLNTRGNERLALGLLGVIAEHYGHILPGKDIMTPQLPDPHR